MRLAFLLSKGSRKESWSLRGWVIAVAAISTGGALLTGALAGWYSWHEQKARLDTGSRHTCGLEQNGVAKCWGKNVSGELGTGSTTPTTVPTIVSTSARFVSITAGNNHSCGIAVDQRAYCWG